MKEGALYNEAMFPWYWDKTQAVAAAPGISCYKKGVSYAHGGVSLQECLVLDMEVVMAAHTGESVNITNIVWQGLRCKAEVRGQPQGASMDIRTRPGNPESSIVTESKRIRESGTASVLVTDKMSSEIIGEL